ncbi:MAG: hypothetical protein ACLFVN_00395 [Phycisphaeraceae bacterium]
MERKMWVIAAIAAGIFVGPAAMAQDQEDGEQLPPVVQEETLEVAEEADLPAEEDRWSLWVGGSFASEYISRGLAFSSEPSFQPWAELYYSLETPENAQWLESASLFFGTWNSMQDGDPGLGQQRSGRVSNWYENDLYTGVTANVLENWTTSFAYYYYNSPSDSWDSYHELEWKLSYDDTGMWEDFALEGFGLNPGVRLTHEISRPNTEDAFYAQLSLEPSFQASGGSQPLTVSVPLVVGLADGYYTNAQGGDETYGYFLTGLKASTPLDVLPEDAGALTLHGGVDVWFLPTDVANGLDESTEVVGKIGMTWNY